MSELEDLQVGLMQLSLGARVRRLRCFRACGDTSVLRLIRVRLKSLELAAVELRRVLGEIRCREWCLGVLELCFKGSGDRKGRKDGIGCPLLPFL